MGRGCEINILSKYALLKNKCIQLSLMQVVVKITEIHSGNGWKAAKGVRILLTASEVNIKVIISVMAVSTFTTHHKHDFERNGLDFSNFLW